MTILYSTPATTAPASAAPHTERKAIQIHPQHDVGYYAHCGPNLSKLLSCVTIKFLVLRSPSPKLYRRAYPWWICRISNPTPPNWTQGIQARTSINLESLYARPHPIIARDTRQRVVQQSTISGTDTDISLVRSNPSNEYNKKKVYFGTILRIKIRGNN